MGVSQDPSPAHVPECCLTIPPQQERTGSLLEAKWPTQERDRIPKQGSPSVTTWPPHSEADPLIQTASNQLFEASLWKVNRWPRITSHWRKPPTWNSLTGKRSSEETKNIRGADKARNPKTKQKLQLQKRKRMYTEKNGKRYLVKRRQNKKCFKKCFKFSRRDRS